MFSSLNIEFLNQILSKNIISSIIIIIIIYILGLLQGDTGHREAGVAGAGGGEEPRGGGSAHHQGAKEGPQVASLL